MSDTLITISESKLSEIIEKVLTGASSCEAMEAILDGMGKDCNNNCANCEKFLSQTITDRIKQCATIIRAEAVIKE